MNAILLAAGFLSVYFGYRLFCSFTRRSLSMISGALLAIFGIALLIGEAKAYTIHRNPAARGIHTNPRWHNGSVPSHSRHQPVEYIV